MLWLNVTDIVTFYIECHPTAKCFRLSQTVVVVASHTGRHRAYHHAGARREHPCRDPLTGTDGDGPRVEHPPDGLVRHIQESPTARFSKLDGHTYESPDYDDAANKVEITVSSGAGDVSVNTN
jgi:hypothetical protein